MADVDGGMVRFPSHSHRVVYLPILPQRPFKKAGTAQPCRFTSFLFQPCLGRQCSGY
jgi:hypothetical protein